MATVVLRDQKDRNNGTCKKIIGINTVQNVEIKETWKYGEVIVRLDAEG